VEPANCVLGRLHAIARGCAILQQSLVENIAFTSFVERLQVWTCCTVFCFVAIELSASGDQTTDIHTTFDFAMIAKIICNVRHS
jgi:hypothetical protein